jgi:hypothetical protein
VKRAPILVGAVLLLGAAAARAQDVEERGDGGDRPWAEGVSPERQEKAQALFASGNDLFAAGELAQALAKYREAIDAWDHPAVRLNMAAARIELDQPLAAYEDLERALRYGRAPLAPAKYAQALTYRKLLLAQLAQLKVSCNEPGVEVLLDGKQLLVGPRDVTLVVLPGPHQLVAAKEGHLTTTRAVVLVAGRLDEEEIGVTPIRRPPRVERHWPTWLPWTVLATGGALALAAAPLEIDASARFADYDTAVSSMCPRGCASQKLDAATRDSKSTAGVENSLALGLVVSGVALVGTGVVMLLLNQPRLVDDAPPRVTVVPTVGIRSAAVSVSWSL